MKKIWSLALCGFAAVVHMPLLLSQGQPWDGWLLMAWLRQKDTVIVERFFHEVGKPFTGKLFLLLGSLGDPLLTINLTSYICILVAGLFVALAFRETGWFSNSSVILFGVLAVILPEVKVNTDAALVFYMVCYAAFAIGLWLMFRALIREQGAKHWGFRVASWFFIWVSLFMNSLLIFFYGMVLIPFLAKKEKISWQKTVAYGLSVTDYLLLPPLYWLFKKKFFCIGLTWVGELLCL